LTFHGPVIFNLGKNMNKQLSSEDAVAAYGGNRFELVLAASQRARELKNGHAARVAGKNGPIVTALNEIEQGKYTRSDFLKTIKLKKKGHRDEFDIA
jgi:DNA-directed RNA polymerase omega subunit